MKTDSILTAKMTVANREYECYGCAGEMPIRKGDYVTGVRLKSVSGEFNTYHLCMRCACALQVKLNFKPVVKLDKGDLQYSRLANSFKKSWQAMVTAVCKAKDDAERKEVVQPYLKQWGIKTVETATKKTRGKTHPAQKKLRAIQKTLKAVIAELAEIDTGLTRAHLAAKIEIQKAKGDITPCDTSTALKKRITALIPRLLELCEDSKEASKNENQN